MSKKKNKQRHEAAGESGNNTLEEESFAPAGIKLMLCGVGALALGFLVLSRADALGRNWAAGLSPFLILGGYVLIGVGVFWKEGGDGVSSAPPSQPPQA